MSLKTKPTRPMFRHTLQGNLPTLRLLGQNCPPKMICNENKMEIQLLEYGSHPISVIGSKSITIKISADGKTIALGYGRYSESTRRITVKDSLILFKALCESKDLAMYILIEDYGRDTYLFDIPTSGFAHAYNQAFIQDKAGSL